MTRNSEAIALFHACFWGTVMDPFSMAFNVVHLYSQISALRELMKHEALLYAAACRVVANYMLSVEVEQIKSREFKYEKEGDSISIRNVGDDYRKKHGE